MYLSHCDQWRWECQKGGKEGGRKRMRKNARQLGRKRWGQNGVFWGKMVYTDSLSLLTYRPRTSSIQSCWQTCTPVVTRTRWWRSRRSRPSDAMKCCACTTPWRRPSTSSGTSTPAPSAPPCPHRWTTLGCRCRAYRPDAGTRGSGGEPRRPAWCLFSALLGPPTDTGSPPLLPVDEESWVFLLAGS